MGQIQFTIVDAWETKQITRLYQEAGWWKDEYNPLEIPGLVKASFRFVIGITEDTQETVAMGRIISDGVSVGIIQDMCVLIQCRGMGIGTQLLRYLVNIAKEAGLKNIFLVAEPGTCTFYEKSGFISNKNQIFLLHT